MIESLPSAIADYRVVRLLGQGGMATVYEVLSSTGRRGALKLFTLDHGQIDFLRKRFRSEYEVLRRLSHPRLVTVWDAGEDPATGRPFFVMDLVENSSHQRETLEDVRREGKFTALDARRWYGDLVEALSYCHRQGVVHRDVKLENVLVGPDGHVVLSDFGVARICDASLRHEMAVTTTFVEGETTQTRPVMGTYWYLSPELRAGETATFASDAYALGVLFFRLLTGLWYEPDTQAFELLAPYPREWRTILASLLASDPAARHFSPRPSFIRIDKRIIKWGILFLIFLFSVISLIRGWRDEPRKPDEVFHLNSNPLPINAPSQDLKTISETIDRYLKEAHKIPNYPRASNRPQ